MGKKSTPFKPVASTEVLGRKQAALNGDSIGRKLDFYLIRTTLDITPGAYESTSQKRLNALIEVIGMRAQPIIVSVEPPNVEVNPADLPVSTGSTTVFAFKFAIEHYGAWAGSVPSLEHAINGVLDFVHTNSVLDNVSVTRFSSV